MAAEKEKVRRGFGGMYSLQNRHNTSEKGYTNRPF